MKDASKRISTLLIGIGIVMYVISARFLSVTSNGGHVISTSIAFYIPIVAWIFLLAGGIVFRKERAISGGIQ